MDVVEARPSWWRRRNWWKIAFFALLVVWEFTREIAVLNADPGDKVATVPTMVTTANWTTAQGRWTRIDGGGALLPGATVIQCDEDKAECVEATASMFDGYLGTPDVSTYEAKFTPDAINYENDVPLCARYSVRLDRKLEKVFAVRERKPNATGPLCDKLERRMEMTLGQGFQENAKPFGDHFVPLVRLGGLLL